MAQRYDGRTLRAEVRVLVKPWLSLVEVRVLVKPWLSLVEVAVVAVVALLWSRLQMLIVVVSFLKM